MTDHRGTTCKPPKVKTIYSDPKSSAYVPISREERERMLVYLRRQANLRRHREDKELRDAFEFTITKVDQSLDAFAACPYCKERNWNTHAMPTKRTVTEVTEGRPHWYKCDTCDVVLGGYIGV